VRRGAGTLAFAVVLSTAACRERLLEQIPSGGKNITINVTACDLDRATGLATATFELTSREEYSSVLLNAQLSDESGIVIGIGTGAVNGVEPGTTYRDDILFSVSGEPEGEVSCNVGVELANP
jgi:hypothetical protein